MLVDLIHVVTRDGVRLDGMMQRPPVLGSSRLGVDAVLCVHGTGGSFYSSPLFDVLADRLMPSGCAILRVNTRGHDGISTATTAQGGRRIGAAYEVVDDCRHDQAAWIDWLLRNGHQRIGLIGHSLGAVKSMYALAREPQSSVAGLIALSPPRLSHLQFRESTSGADFLTTYESAEQLVRAGAAQSLIEVQLPLPMVITAGGYVEKYGPDERYNFLQFIARVANPIRLTFGSVELENNLAFRGLPEQLAPIAATHPSMQVDTIARADHFYSAVRPELAERVESWLRELT